MIVTPQVLVRLLEMWPQNAVFANATFTGYDWTFTDELDKRLFDKGYICGCGGIREGDSWKGMHITLSPKGARLVAAVLGVASAIEPILQEATR